MKKYYVYNCKEKKEDPAIIVKWCRRTFGNRGDGWDFSLISGNITIEIWHDKLQVMYVLCKKIELNNFKH